MADQDQTAQENNQPTFNMQRVYLKDMSLEMPNAPQAFLEQDAQQVEVNVNIGGQRLAETIFESTVTATVTTRVNDKVLYLVEATQAGIFEMSNLPDEQLDQMLGIFCPDMLFAYLRANIADIITRSSLPALHLNQVNFQALYEQRLADAAAQAEGNTNGTETPSIIVPASSTRQ